MVTTLSQTAEVRDNKGGKVRITLYGGGSAAICFGC